MTHHHHAPEPNYPALGTITGLTMAGLACLGCILGTPSSDALVAVPPELSSAAPLIPGPGSVSAGHFAGPPEHTYLRLTDFSRMSGDRDGLGPQAPSSDGAGRPNWGDAQLHHHRPHEGQRHEHWAAPSADGGHRRVRDGHRLHGEHRAAPGRHRHVDGHHADRGRVDHPDSAGRHHRADNHVGEHHQGAHSHGGHHAHD